MEIVIFWVKFSSDTEAQGDYMTCPKLYTEYSSRDRIEIQGSDSQVHSAQNCRFFFLVVIIWKAGQPKI